MSAPKIPIGPATTAGYSVSAASFALAIVAYLGGDRSDQTIGVIVAGAIGALTFAITQLGRYAQAHAHIHAQAQAQAVRAAPLIAPGGLVVTATNAPVGAPPAAEPDVEPGDPDALAHLPVADPANVPADQGDAGIADAENGHDDEQR